MIDGRLCKLGRRGHSDRTERTRHGHFRRRHAVRRIDGGGARKAQQSYLNVEAGQAVAQGTQEASDTALQTKYIISNVRGAAGASGAVATSPDVVNVEGQIAARGSYNALSEMYQQNEKAIGLTYQGQIAAATGEVTQQADVTKALSTVLTGAGSLATKYGSPTGNNSISPASIATYGYGYM